jgi:hypothetical protein
MPGGSESRPISGSVAQRPSRSVAAHLLGNPPGGFGELDERIDRALHEDAGPDGFVYEYGKLYAVARAPDA